MIHVNSEINYLKKLIIHEPDAGIARITPKQAEELLFDDIVFYPKMKEEHKVYSNLLDMLIGKNNVHRAADLLEEAMNYSPKGKETIINKIINYEELPSSYFDKLMNLDIPTLTKSLLTGKIESENLIFCNPIPNFIFTRDIAVTVNDHVIITKASKEARFRENILTRFIFWNHPMFEQIKKEGKIINLNLPDIFPPSSTGESVSLEGGDMMILNKNYLLIGGSERSNDHAFESLKKVLFEKGVIDNVVQIKIPSDRAFMHIDTLFTQVDEHLIVGYKPIINEGESSFVSVHNKSGEKRIYPTLESFILAEVDSKMEFIYSGGGESPDQEREQWTDACNLLTLKPGVAIAYDRNISTAKEFDKKGYSIVSASKFVDLFMENPVKLENIHKTIFTLESAELSRARGGSHCMSCPILRAK